ncbi:MAG TPA: cyclodeaminase/cyclohydrolase family protein [Polyangia bacterium]|nr:cyclodeaminase/cyclohydrolase family protein [Polyangia bacterium]
MTLWQLRLDEFRDQTASAAPTPGGGSVACVCATLGAGLVIMAGEITRKTKPAAELAELDRLLDELRALSAQLSASAEADVAVFGDFMAALKLPRGSDDEKAARKQAIGRAAVAACEAPLEAAGAMRLCLTLTANGGALIKPEVESDVKAGADLLRGALTAVLYNVDINLPYVPDGDVKRTLVARLNELRR